MASILVLEPQLHPSMGVTLCAGMASERLCSTSSSGERSRPSRQAEALFELQGAL